MNTEIDPQLRTAITTIYRLANEYADEHDGVEHGMNILYGPPIPNPDVMIVSAQGGGGDLKRQRTWPPRLEYLHSKYRFGNRLVRDFADAGMSDVLESSTVATNIAFPQFKGGFDRWMKQGGSGEWLERSLDWVQQLVRLMPPKVVLTYGSHAFRHLVGRKKEGGQYRIDEDRWLGVQVIGCGHLMQGSTKVSRMCAMERVKEAIA